MRDDPPIREDGRCVCGKPRKMPKGAMYAKAAARDPFCSATCCRRYHGLVTHETTSGRWADREEAA